MIFDGYDGLAKIERAHFSSPVAAVRPYAPSEPAEHRSRSFTRGVAWITVAMILFAGLAAFAKGLISAGVHPWQVVFLRNLIAVLAMTPLLALRGVELVRTPNMKLYLARSAISVGSMLSWFYALSLIPIGELTSISFLAPLFGTLCAVLVLGEVVRLRRWTALFVGFIGAMIILRPTGAAFGVGQLCALFSAFSGGLLAILIKQLTSRDDTNQIVFLTNLMMTPASLVPALFVWTWPALDIAPLLVGMGACAVPGHIALTRAYALLDASMAMTLEFSRLPFATAIAYLAFGEMIDMWTWIGAFIIFSSAVYITRREAMLRRQNATAGALKNV